MASHPGLAYLGIKVDFASSYSARAFLMFSSLFSGTTVIWIAATLNFNHYPSSTTALSYCIIHATDVPTKTTTPKPDLAGIAVPR